MRRATIMNINEFVKRLRKSQTELESKQEVINKKEFVSTKQGVEVKVLGTKEIKSIKIDPLLLDPDDSETLEMVLQTLLNEVFKKIDSEFQKIEEELGQGMPF